MVVGSPGGSAIINFVAKTLVGVLDWGLDIQAAISLPNMGSRNKDTELERARLEALAPALGDGTSAAHHRVSQRHPRHRDRAGRLAGVARIRAAKAWRGAARRAAPACAAPLAGLWFLAAQRRRQSRRNLAGVRDSDRRAHAPVVALFQQHAAMAGMRMGQGLVHTVCTAAAGTPRAASGPPAQRPRARRQQRRQGVAQGHSGWPAGRRWPRSAGSRASSGAPACRPAARTGGCCPRPGRSGRWRWAAFHRARCWDARCRCGPASCRCRNSWARAGAAATARSHTA